MRSVGTPPGESEAAAVAGVGRGESVEGERALGWKEFTPKEVDRRRCMARTWLGGRGGQCQSAPGLGRGGRYCKVHGAKEGKDGWLGAVDGAIPEKKLGEFIRARKKREGEKTESKGGALQRLRRAGFTRGAEEGVAESTVREVDDGGVEVEEGSASAGVAKSAASPGAAASLAAGAAEERRVLEAERGVGDRAKVRLMQKRSEARARLSEAEAGKR